MLDRFALVVLVLGVTTMGFGFQLTIADQAASGAITAWRLVVVVVGLIVSCIAGYVVGRSVAEPDAWSPRDE